MKRNVLIICLCLCVRLCYADEKLIGAPIHGTGWVGLDFGVECVLTIAGYQPAEAGGPVSVQLGIFEGANRADFMDALPLAIIETDQSVAGWNYVRVNCSRSFRYVRFVGSDRHKLHMPEVEFWGDIAHGSDSLLFQLTNLPTVYIHTLNNQLPYDKEHEIECFVSIISDEGRTLLFDTATIRLRGNASMGFPKKPYRIKFAHKHKVLGSPANAKKWTLINNYGDKTLMRNQLAFELSRRFGMPYTPFCAYVDVVVNGDYKGCYQLCDQIEVRKNRVEITEMNPRDNSGDLLTGGYLFEADAYAGDEPNQNGVFYSDRGTPVTIKSPDEDSITVEQREYIRAHYSRMEPGTGWKKYLDLNTFLRHFLVGEVSGNTDTYWSVYMYKQRLNDTVYFGPVWDFDLAFENDNRTYPINNLNDYIYRTAGSTTGYMRTLVDKIVVQDASARRQLESLWAEIRRSGFTEESMQEYIDEQAELLEQSQHLNFIRWPILNQLVHQNPRARGSFKAEVDNVRSYMRKRFAWMDRKLGFDPSTIPPTQGVTDVEIPVRAEKIVLDGQVLIRRNGVLYTITGQIWNDET